MQPRSPTLTSPEHLEHTCLLSALELEPSALKSLGLGQLPTPRLPQPKRGYPSIARGFLWSLIARG